jgi:hypothetical protein
MTTITQKKKKSIWLWVLIIVAFTTLVALVVCNFLGIIDLSFVGAGFLSLQMWSASSITNAVLLDIGLVVLGVAAYWVLITYFIGTKVSTPAGTTQPGYTPQPVYPSQPQKDTETVISQ